MKTRHLLKTLLLTGVCSLAIGVTSSAFGQTILIDFGMASGTVNTVAATNLITTSPSANGPDGNGNYWTNFYGTGAPGAVLATGSNKILTTTSNGTTGITMTYVSTTSNGTLNYNGGDAVNLSYVPLSLITNPNFRVATAAQDIFFMNTGGAAVATSTFTLTGLDNAKQYTFEIFGTRPTSIAETRGASWVATGSNSASGSYLTSNTSFTGTNSTTYFGNFNSLILSSITPTAGSITLTMQYAGASGSLNAMQITAVPEPATWALLSFSLTAVMVLRRRRQA